MELENTKLENLEAEKIDKKLKYLKWINPFFWINFR